MSRAAKISSAIGGAILVVVLVVAIAIAGVGGSGDDDAAARSDGGSQSAQGFPGGGNGQAPSGADQEALGEFQDCLEEQGVELPEAGSQGGGGQGGEPPSGSDQDNSELQEAMSACQDKLPEGAGPQ